MGSVSGLRDSRVDVAEEKYAARRADSDCVCAGDCQYAKRGRGGGVEATAERSLLRCVGRSAIPRCVRCARGA